MEFVQSGLAVVDLLLQYAIPIAVLGFAGKMMYEVAPHLFQMPRNMGTKEKAVLATVSILIFLALPKVVGYVFSGLITSVSDAVAESLPSLDSVGANVSGVLIPDPVEFSSAWESGTVPTRQPTVVELPIQATPVPPSIEPTSVATAPTIVPTVTDYSVYDPSSGALPPTPASGD